MVEVLALGKSNVIIVLLLALTYYANGQDLSISLESAKRQLNRGDTSIQLRISISNKGKRTAMLYGFGHMEPGREPISKYFDGNNTCATGVFFSRYGNSVYLMKMPTLESLMRPVPDSTKYAAKSFRTIGEVLDSAKLTLKAEETFSTNVVISIHKNWVKEGKYKMFILYYCGKNLPNVIDMKKANAYAASKGAIIYRGAVRSNEIVIEAVR